MKKPSMVFSYFLTVALELVTSNPITIAFMEWKKGFSSCRLFDASSSFSLHGANSLLWVVTLYTKARKYYLASQNTKTKY